MPQLINSDLWVYTAKTTSKDRPKCHLVVESVVGHMWAEICASDPNGSVMFQGFRVPEDFEAEKH